MSNRIMATGASLSKIDALQGVINAMPAKWPAPILTTPGVAARSLGMLPHILGEKIALPATHPRMPRRIEPCHIYLALRNVQVDRSSMLTDMARHWRNFPSARRTPRPAGRHDTDPA